MAMFISADTVVRALRALSQTSFRRPGRTAATGFLLLKAKEPARGDWIDITSQGGTSVEPELKRFLRVAPGTPAPDVNPFGSHEGSIEYLAEGYERRGTYTHLYEGRNLSGFLQVEATGKAFRVRIPDDAPAAVLERLGRKIPLEPAAAFLLRSEAFSDSPTVDDVVSRFRDVFHLLEHDLEVLFERTGFEITFSNTPFKDDISALPSDLQPKTPTATHTATARAAKVLVPLARPKMAELVLDDKLRRRVQRAFARSKAIALVGPPGTAKSRLWAELLEEAASEPEMLALKRPPTYLSVTAEVDWTARTIIGGYYPQEDGKLVFREGYLLQAIKSDQLLWIDEMNRADLDRVLGPFLTFLAGQPVDLGLSHLGSDAGTVRPKKMVLAWGSGPESGYKEDEEQRVYYAGTDWRVIGTYNNADRARVFPMGSALQRRWALIPVSPVAPAHAREIFGQLDVSVPIIDALVRAYDLHLQYLPIGIAPFIDMARYVAGSGDGTSGGITSEEHELLEDAYVLFMGQQLSRLDPERRKEFFDELAKVLGSDLATEAARL